MTWSEREEQACNEIAEALAEREAGRWQVGDELLIIAPTLDDPEDVKRLKAVAEDLKAYTDLKTLKWMRETAAAFKSADTRKEMTIEEAYKLLRSRKQRRR